MFLWAKREKIVSHNFCHESKLLHQGCIRNWCYTIDAQLKEEKTEYIPVVCEFGDVFPEELPGLPS